MPEGMRTGVKVGFISVVYNKVGGVETWHKSLVPSLRHRVDIRGVVSINDPHSSIKDLEVDWGAGEQDALQLIRKIDVLVLWGDDSPGRFFAKKTLKKVICVHHGDEIGAWAFDVIRKQSKFATDIVAVNPIVAEENGYTYIPNAVSNNRIATFSAPDSKTVLWAHRLSSEKRPELAVEIAKIMPDFKFIFAGDGFLRGWIKNNLPTNSEFVGRVPTLIHHLERSSVFLATADQEGFGYSVLEAICSGVPVVSSHTGIAKNLADATITDENVLGWAEAIRACSGSIAKNMNKAKELYSHERFIDQWSSFLR
jgi:glycosyltransferase involved in cell wall biosynthesis